MASNSLDEYIIRDPAPSGRQDRLLRRGRAAYYLQVRVVFGGVKLAAVEDGEGHIIPKIKISENRPRSPTPTSKRSTAWSPATRAKPLADLITLYDETVDDSRPLELFDPDATWKRKTFTDFEAKELLVPIFRNGKLVYQSPTITEMRACGAPDRPPLG